MGRGPRPPPMLEVHQMYEPTRLAAACLEAAYARIVPVPWRHAGSDRGPHINNVSSHEQHETPLPPGQEVRHG
jgi:hypothetical protein